MAKRGRPKKKTPKKETTSATPGRKSRELIVLEDIAATAAATAADLLWIRSALAAEIAEKPINNPELHRDKEFIESGGVKCPRCKSTEVATGPVDFGDDGRRAFCMIECLSCEEKVYQVFELVGWSRNNEWLK